MIITNLKKAFKGKGKIIMKKEKREERNSMIIKNYKEGLSLKEISEKYDISQQQIINIVRNKKIKMRNRKKL